MNKSIATLIDELTVVNIKLFHLEEKIEKDKHTQEEGKRKKN